MKYIISVGLILLLSAVCTPAMGDESVNYSGVAGDWYTIRELIDKNGFGQPICEKMKLNMDNDALSSLWGTFGYGGKIDLITTVRETKCGGTIHFAGDWKDGDLSLEGKSGDAPLDFTSECGKGWTSFEGRMVLNDRSTTKEWRWRGWRTAPKDWKEPPKCTCDDIAGLWYTKREKYDGNKIVQTIPEKLELSIVDKRKDGCVVNGKFEDGRTFEVPVKDQTNPILFEGDWSGNGKSGSFLISIGKDSKGDIDLAGTYGEQRGNSLDWVWRGFKRPAIPAPLGDLIEALKMKNRDAVARDIIPQLKGEISEDQRKLCIECLIQLYSGKKLSELPEDIRDAIQESMRKNPELWR